ncbi:hypothetical protein OF83DRAFT_1160537 [Amylostereum chailletii]|nr:hypothetical protein OF83DRAFT_1160537 [Amylostereum chailletii]
MFTKSTSSRKYIDLIKEASSKWASWDPPNPIVAGDFGVVERATGEFVRGGNIYTHPVVAALAALHPPTASAALDTHIVSTFHARKRDLTLGVSVEIAGLADAAVKAEFGFDSKRGALLVMHKPRTTRVPPEFLRAVTASSAATAALQGKALVTEAFACPAFVLYLSNKAGETLRLVLRDVMPIPHVPGLSAGPDIAAGWWTDGGTGVLQQAYGAEYDFYPLFQLKTVRKPAVWDIRRNGEVLEDPDAFRWVDVETPWEDLDSDGEEIEDRPYESGSENDAF